MRYHLDPTIMTLVVYSFDSVNRFEFLLNARLILGICKSSGSKRKISVSMGLILYSSSELCLLYASPVPFYYVLLLLNV